MREYVADKQVGKRMCRQRRRGMLVHKVGVAVLVLSLCGMLVADAALVRRAGGFSPEVLVLMAAVSFFFCLVAALGAAPMPNVSMLDEMALASSAAGTGLMTV